MLISVVVSIVLDIIASAAGGAGATAGAVGNTTTHVIEVEQKYDAEEGRERLAATASGPVCGAANWRCWRWARGLAGRSVCGKSHWKVLLPGGTDRSVPLYSFLTVFRFPDLGSTVPERVSRFRTQPEPKTKE